MSAQFQSLRPEASTFVDRVTGQAILQLTHSSQRSVHGYYDNPPWCPLTKRIAFSRMDEGADEGDIYIMDHDGGNLTRIAHSYQMTANDGAMAQWSPDGKRVYFRDRDRGQPLIAWVDVDKEERGECPGDLRMLAPTGDRNAFHDNCSFYPDEEVVKRRDEFGLYVQDLDTGRSERLVSVADCWAIHPRRDEIADWHLYIKHSKWSADGARLLFVFTNEIRYADKYAELPRVKDIYVVNADGTGLKRVGEFGNHPIWHPDGRQVLTNSPFEGRPNNSLVLDHVETGTRTLATDRIAGSGHPSYSPDGKYISVDYVLRGEGYGSLNLVDLESDAVRQLNHVRVRDHSHVGTHLHPVWSQDGSQILYASDAGGTAQLCVMDI